MKLNQDCIRDLLLYLENNLSYTTNKININNLHLKNYTEDELIYTAEKLFEGNYITYVIAKAYNPPVIVVTGITYNGHQFLDNIRDDKVWKKTKSILSKVSSASINIISEIAAKVLSDIISKQMNLS